jgi:GT2 family glycosyltransferase
MAFSQKKSDHISILICSRERRNELEHLVSKLRNMNTPYTIQIVVVEETDHPRPIEGVEYVAHPVANRGISYARNLTLTQARGDILVFLDDDCIIHEGWLENLLEPFQDESVLGIQGGVTVPQSTNAIGWAESLLGFPGGGLGRVLKAKGSSQRTKEISTLNCAYRKWVVDKVGGFEKSLKITGEDYVLAKQVCEYGDCLFIPSAMVSHEARGKLSKIWHWFVRRGRAEVDVIRSHTQGELTTWRLVRGSLTLKLLFLIVICALFPHLVGYLLLASLLSYAFLQYARCYGIWHESGAPLRALIVLPMVKLTMDLAVDWGRLRGWAFD